MSKSLLERMVVSGGSAMSRISGMNQTGATHITDTYKKETVYIPGLDKMRNPSIIDTKDSPILSSYKVSRMSLEEERHMNESSNQYFDSSLGRPGTTKQQKKKRKPRKKRSKTYGRK